MSKEFTAAIIIVGDEILSGRTRDINANFIAARLHQRGIYLKRIITIPDDMETIVGKVREYSEKYDNVFVCGGIGATPDDLTREAMARAFETTLERNKAAEAMLCAYYGERINDLRLMMADLPIGCRLIENELSGAPGFIMGNVYVFPGVPKLMQKMFDVIESELPQGSIVTLEYLSPIGETLFADLMEAAQNKYPDVKIGSYPELDEASGKWRCKLTFTSSTEEAIAPCRDMLLTAIAERADRGKN